MRRGAPSSLLAGLAAAGVTCVTPRQTAAQSVDTATAFAALSDARAACTADGGRLWGRSLCGGIALVDRQTRLAVTNDSVPRRHFVPLSAAYLTTLPPEQFVANTAFDWNGRTWTMVMLPLPKDRFSRVALVMHEVFHREQKALGLNQVDRAFAYGTGPAIGVLLDYFAPDWRAAIRSRRDLSGLLETAIHYSRPAPAHLADAAARRANDYGWSEVDRAEAEREAARAPMLADYTKRLVSGPTITFEQSKDSLRRFVPSLAARASDLT